MILLIITMMKKSLYFKSIKAFSLIELSIVMIIISLLVSAILVGKSLINNATLRSVISTANNLQIAIKTFQANYNYLPGDFPSASTYWGSATCLVGNTNTNVSNCDGNGDGMIAGVVGSADATAEGTRALQHLSLAKLIGGNYIGGNGEFILGKNILPTAINDIGYNIQYSTIYLSPKLYNNFDNFIILSASYSNSQPGANSLSATDAYFIDAKIDDGLPNKGKILSYTGYFVTGSGSCIDNNAYNYLNSPENKAVCVLAKLIY